MTPLGKNIDSVYIRETLIIYSKELVPNTPPDIVQQIINIKETNRDTITVK